MHSRLESRQASKSNMGRVSITLEALPGDALVFLPWYALGQLARSSKLWRGAAAKSGVLPLQRVSGGAAPRNSKSQLCALIADSFTIGRATTKQRPNLPLAVCARLR